MNGITASLTAFRAIDSKNGCMVIFQALGFNFEPGNVVLLIDKKHNSSLVPCNSIRNKEEIIFEPTLHSCGKILMEVYLKVLAILRANGVDVAPDYCFLEYHSN